MNALRHPATDWSDAPVNVYWEMTVACDLACRHCRADALKVRDPNELTTDEGFALIREVKALGSHLVMTGGDPLQRPDLFELIAYARSLNVPVAVTPAVTPRLTADVIARFKDAGVAMLGMSLDGPDAASHDGFRQVEGTFAMSMRALADARAVGMPVQINTTITRDTITRVPAMFELLRARCAPPVRRWSLFVLIPVGRGQSLGSASAEQIEDLFAWVYDRTQGAPFHVSTVEAPQWRRYWMQRRAAEGASDEEIQRAARRMGFGIRDGSGVIFVSHTGDVYPAGFLPYPLLGNVRTGELSAIYRTSPKLAALRAVDDLQGRCGRCEFRGPCGGSRARAWALTGDAMGSDPLCAYEPAAAP